MYSKYTAQRERKRERKESFVNWYSKHSFAMHSSPLPPNSHVKGKFDNIKATKLNDLSSTFRCVLYIVSKLIVSIKFSYRWCSDCWKPWHATRDVLFLSFYEVRTFFFPGELLSTSLRDTRQVIRRKVCCTHGCARCWRTRGYKKKRPRSDFPSETSALLFSPRDERQIGGSKESGRCKRAEMVFIRVSLKSRFSKRLSPLSRYYHRAFCVKPRADFCTRPVRDGGLSWKRDGPGNPTRRRLLFIRDFMLK